MGRIFTGLSLAVLVEPQTKLSFREIQLWAISAIKRRWQKKNILCSICSATWPLGQMRSKTKWLHLISAINPIIRVSKQKGPYVYKCATPALGSAGLVVVHEMDSGDSLIWWHTASDSNTNTHFIHPLNFKYLLNFFKIQMWSESVTKKRHQNCILSSFICFYHRLSICLFLSVVCLYLFLAGSERPSFNGLNTLLKRVYQLMLGQ